MILDGQEEVLTQPDFVSSKVMYKQVSAYFNPKTWRNKGDMKHMAFVSDIYVNDITKMQQMNMPVSLDLIKYYGQRWWDTSTLAGLDFLFL